VPQNGGNYGGEKRHGFPLAWAQKERTERKGKEETTELEREKWCFSKKRGQLLYAHHPCHLPGIGVIKIAQAPRRVLGRVGGHGAE